MYQIDRDLLGYYVKKANTTYAALAEEMDIDRSTLSRHIATNTLTVAEMYVFIRALSLTKEDVFLIFFAKKVA
ncbi:MAG TPA: hypothetical protein DCF66_06380 [Lachnospiraceae bacterium]|nr:hypothetical protein [Lachnospiraceae bacterium]